MQFTTSDGKIIELAKCERYGRYFRTIEVDGEKWGHIVSIGHGCRGPSYEFENIRGRRIAAVDSEKSRYGRNESVKGDRVSRAYVVNPVKPRPIDDVLKIAVKAMIDDGRMQEPAKLHAEQQAHEARMTEIDAEIEDERKLVRATLIKLAHADTATDLDKKGLSLAYKDLFHNEMPEA